ncbi:MAG: glycogen/starch/alpha-glucan phosphorylase, partial [Oscillospiraceae bacterium]|nr:glycogen/starch/alpha-glucan phosphorylase [Oscillospiraceae bacterium]
VSQQISTAGKEASGTGNMKFMMNGALTVGTLDGANVEMHEVLGDENMFLFGLKTEEVKEVRDRGYNPFNLYSRDPNLHRVLDQISNGFRDGVRYDELVQYLLLGSNCSMPDQYMLLADFASYCAAMRRMAETYGNRTKWNQMSLHNIARSGIFAADRSIADYAETIWHVPYKK